VGQALSAASTRPARVFGARAARHEADYIGAAACGEGQAKSSQGLVAARSRDSRSSFSQRAEADRVDTSDDRSQNGLALRASTNPARGVRASSSSEASQGATTSK